MAQRSGAVEIEQRRQKKDAHRFGLYLVVNLNIGIDGGLSVKERDRTATEVEETQLKHIQSLRRVYVHYHPVEDGSNGI